MNRINQVSRLGLVFAFIFILSGCSGGNGTVGYVNGKVTVPDAKSPEGLLVRFANGATGIGANAVVAEDGTYELKCKGSKGVPVGTYKISVTAYKRPLTDKEYSDSMSAPSAEQKKVKDEQNAKKKLVPKKYRLPTTSGLSYEVVSGSQEHNLNLTE